MEIQAMEDRVNLWYEHDVKMGIKSPKTKPEQADLDKSESWQNYVLLHRKIQQARSEIDFAISEPGVVLKGFPDCPVPGCRIGIGFGNLVAIRDGCQNQVAPSEIPETRWT